MPYQTQGPLPWPNPVAQTAEAKCLQIPISMGDQVSGRTKETGSRDSGPSDTAVHFGELESVTQSIASMSLPGENTPDRLASVGTPSAPQPLGDEFVRDDRTKRQRAGLPRIGSVSDLVVGQQHVRPGP